MVERHEILKSHIKERVDKGHDILSIKDDLIDRGVPHHEIHRAIDAFYEEARKAEKLKEETEKFLYPSKGKIILPAAVLIILIMHFAVNIFQLPSVGDDLCTSTKISGSFEGLKNNDTINQQIKDQFIIAQRDILTTQTKLIDRYKVVLTTNFPLIYSKIYLLNPFFTLPCETTFLFNNKRCSYYMSEESYRCLNSTKVKDSNIETVFRYGLPEYKEVSGLSIFINTLLLFIEVYLLASIIVYYHNKLKSKVSHKMKEVMEVSGVLLAVLILIFAVLYYIYLWRLL